MSQYITIPLSKRGKHAGKYEAIVSIEDADLAELNWSIQSPSRNHNYVKRRIGTRKNSIVVLLHHVILVRILGREIQKGEMPDHINGNGLDNRRENLRLATSAQNNMNKSKQTNNHSGYKGVVFHKQSGKWRARIYVDGKQKSLGLFATPELAHRAYYQAAIEYFGDFAHE